MSVDENAPRETKVDVVVAVDVGEGSSLCIFYKDGGCTHAFQGAYRTVHPAGDEFNRFFISLFG